VAGDRNDIASESVVSCPGVGGAGREKKRWGRRGCLLPLCVQAEIDGELTYLVHWGICHPPSRDLAFVTPEIRTNDLKRII